MFFVYILYSKSIDKYYVGQTYNLDLRLLRHKLKSTRFTKRADDWELVHKEEFDSRSDAMKRERFIKSQKSRVFIEEVLS